MMGGRGVKNCLKLRDVFYGRPLTQLLMFIINPNNTTGLVLPKALSPKVCHWPKRIIQFGLISIFSQSSNSHYFPKTGIWSKQGGQCLNNLIYCICSKRNMNVSTRQPTPELSNADRQLLSMSLKFYFLPFLGKDGYFKWEYFQNGYFKSKTISKN